MLRVQGFRLVWIWSGFFFLCGLFLGAASGDPKCNGRPYNASKATCCKGKQTEGVSENMSQCCGQVAFNTLNEICCDSVVHDKTSPNSKCCGKQIYDDNKELCCSNTVRTQLSPDHQCCFETQYNIKLECCCEKFTPRVQVKLNKTLCCAKNISGNFSASSANCDDVTSRKGENEAVCCNGDRVETYFKKTGFQCCGHYYYNPSLWWCCKKRLVSKLDRTFIVSQFNNCL